MICWHDFVVRTHMVKRVNRNNIIPGPRWILVYEIKYWLLIDWRIDVFGEWRMIMVTMHKNQTTTQYLYLYMYI